MPNYSVYDPRAAQRSAKENLMDLAYNKQRFTNEMYAKQQAEQAKAMADADAAGHEQSRNWFNAAASGGAMGAGAGPMGAGIGAGAGALLGIAQGVASRKKKGQGFWGALGETIVKPMGDKFDWEQDIPVQQIAGLASMAGQHAAKASAMKQQGAMGAAAAENAAIRENNAAKMGRYRDVANNWQGAPQGLGEAYSLPQNPRNYRGGA